MLVQPDNQSLAVAFKLAVKRPTERMRLTTAHPELTKALNFYERNEKVFYKNGMNKQGLVILKALKENIYYQIKEDGPSSFCDEDSD